MTWWDQFTAQFWGELFAGALLLSVGLYLEAWLDERREQRHKDDGGWLQRTVDTLIEQRDGKNHQ